MRQYPYCDQLVLFMLPLILKTDIRQRTISQLTTDELQSLKQAIMSLQIIDVDNVHESFLPWLAWQWRAEFWGDDWSIEQRRAVVKEALLMFRYKGTPWAVLRSLDLNGFKAKLIEWHQQNPIGVNGTFKVTISMLPLQRDITDQMQSTVSKSINKNKRGSQHWDVEYQGDISSNAYIGGYQKNIYHARIGPKPPQPIVNGPANTAPYITVFENYEITINE